MRIDLKIQSLTPDPFQMKVHSVGITLGLAIFLTLVASTTEAKEKKAARCQISILTRMKSGTYKKKVLPSQAADRAECEEHAELHRTNFFPPDIADKKVTARWSERGAEQ